LLFGRVRNNEEKAAVNICHVARSQPIVGRGRITRYRSVRVKLLADGDVVAGNQVLDDVEGAVDWAAAAPPRAPNGGRVNMRRRRRPSPLIAADDDDYDDDELQVDKRYMRFGRRRPSDADDDTAAAAAKRYMRFGRVGSHFHPLMGLDKRYMRFGKR